ncbi:Sepiapterin reductase [Chryseobacterium sp. MOF25P]|uniref:SDR family NAD(P)-dependent oxidoreductase n=1 Tax=unclassified Chryseobacterium TaxID=2593645 RepID=UPI0008057EE9|nr:MULTISPECIES: SDR family oxidoreductase [unclassified Chryseobacterium]OBW43348.1 Sepiapterin reductase [Chryseobacterium sp. MOF25P]OBW46994.1 Sepiapterin reductase [Chryseobacterium sp. BGARF1]
MNILITGGSRGIGKGIALELNKAGHDLLLVAKTEANLLVAQSEMENQDLKIELFDCDLSKESEIDRLLQYSKDIDFVPDILIFDAGYGRMESLIESNFQDLSDIMDLNVYHVYHTVKRYYPALKLSGKARIYIIGSTASTEAYTLAPLYGLSKWTLRGYALTLRQELMKDNIGVTLIHPGVTKTDQWNGIDLPQNAFILPSDIGKLINSTLLLSEHALVEELTVRPVSGDLQ